MANYVFTNEALKVAMNRFAKDSPDYEEPSQFGIGIGTTEASIADTDLETPVPFAGLETVDDCDAITGWTDASNCTTTLNTTDNIQGAGCLDHTKDVSGFAGTSSYKTTTSLDFTDKKLNIFIYVKDSTMLAKLADPAFQIKYGSDSSNFLFWTIDNADVSVGWNYFSLDQTDASTVGSPVLTACDYFEFISQSGTTDTWSAGDLAYDYINLASTDDYYDDYEVGFPEVDETNFQVTMRSRLSSLQANGHLISEYGSFNEDTSKKLITRATFTGFSKNQTDELIFVEKILFSNT